MPTDFVALLKKQIEEAKAATARQNRFRRRLHLLSDRMFLREMRAELRLSQSEFAELLQVSTRTFQGWEGGKHIPRSSLLLAQIIREFPEVRGWLADRKW